MQDKVNKGRSRPGVLNYQSKLDEKKIAAAKVFRLNRWSYKKIAERLNVSTMTLYNAVTGKTWKHLVR